VQYNDKGIQCLKLCIFGQISDMPLTVSCTVLCRESTHSVTVSVPSSSPQSVITSLFFKQRHSITVPQRLLPSPLTWLLLAPPACVWWQRQPLPRPLPHPRLGPGLPWPAPGPLPACSGRWLPPGGPSSSLLGQSCSAQWGQGVEGEGEERGGGERRVRGRGEIEGTGILSLRRHVNVPKITKGGSNFPLWAWPQYSASAPGRVPLLAGRLHALQRRKGHGRWQRTCQEGRCDLPPPTRSRLAWRSMQHWGTQGHTTGAKKEHQGRAEQKVRGHQGNNPALVLPGQPS